MGGGTEGRRHHRAQEARACRIPERLEAARQRIHQAVTGGLVGGVAADLKAQSVIGNAGQHGIGGGAFGGLDVVAHG